MVGGGGRLVVAMSMALAMLAGCAVPQPSPPSAAAAMVAEPTPSVAAILPTVTELPRSEIAAIAIPPVERQPVRLLGMTTAEIERLLGHPRFVRHDGAAQIWRFANQSCILDVFFYREGNGYTVRHYEMRAQGLSEATPRPCAGDVSVLLQAKSG